MLAIFLDTETNGLNFYTHRVLEIAFQLIDLGSFNVIDTYEAIVKQPDTVWNTSNPESLSINGFTYEKMQKGKSEDVVSKEIEDLLRKHQITRDNAVFICQNPSFDRAFFAQLISPDRQEELFWPYHWLDLASMYWDFLLHQNKEPWQEGVSKNKIAEHFQIPNEALPHKAMSGVEHLILCYKALFQQRATR